MQTDQNELLALIILDVAAASVSRAVAQKNYAPGVTDTEINPSALHTTRLPRADAREARPCIG